MYYNLSFQNLHVNDTTRGLLIFFVTPAPIIGFNDGMPTKELDLCKQTKNLTDNKISKLSKSKVLLPKDFSNTLEMVENYLKELKDITSSNSIIYKTSPR